MLNVQHSYKQQTEQSSLPTSSKLFLWSSV